MLPNYPLYYDGTNLANIDGVTIYNWKIDDLAKREFNLNKIANRDLSVLTRAEYASKEIVVYAEIARSDRVTTQQALNDLKAVLQPINKTLTISEYGRNINYTCSLYSLDVEWLGPRIDPCVIIFTATNPIGTDSTLSTLINNVNYTAQVNDVSVTIQGSYYTSPLIQVTFNTITGATNQDVTIKNTQTGQGITVHRTWANADVLAVDSENRTVTVNGADVDYSGAFPTFQPGTRTIGYVDSFTTRDINITATGYRKYV